MSQGKPTSVVPPDKISPARWRKERLRFLVTGALSNGFFATKDKYGMGCRLINVGDVYQRDFIIKECSLDRVVISDLEKPIHKVRHGDIFFVRSSLKLEGVGRSAMILNPKEDVVFECHLVRGQPDLGRLNPSYLIRFLNSHHCIHSLISHANIVTMATVGQTILKDIEVPVPPRAEQDAIVEFLDRKLEQIDRFIAAKKRLTALLQEQKAALINRAVMKGVNPDAPMKPSGIEWLGGIPSHWEVKRLKHHFQEVDERTNTGREVLLSLRMAKGLVPHNDVSERPIGHQDLIGYKIVRPGQLVMNRMRAASGLFGVVSTAGLVSPDYAVLIVRSNINLNYFLHLFKQAGVQAEFFLESKGLGTGSSGFLRLYTDRFGRIPMPLPPKDEQDQIVEWIRKEASQLDALIVNAEREIELIQELRTTLISDAVTGKIRIDGGCRR